MLSHVQQSQSFGVDPLRLAHGAYAEDSECEIGEGDIVASYSADRIAEGTSIRKPFVWQGALWVCIGICGRGRGNQTVEAYRLTTANVFAGEPTTYSRKVAIQGGDFARNDPSGFYHAMAVNAGPYGTLVLTGPPAAFVADETQRAPTQIGLFG